MLNYVDYWKNNIKYNHLSNIRVMILLYKKIEDIFKKFEICNKTGIITMVETKRKEKTTIKYQLNSIINLKYDRIKISLTFKN